MTVWFCSTHQYQPVSNNTTQKSRFDTGRFATEIASGLHQAAGKELISLATTLSTTLTHAWLHDFCFICCDLFIFTLCVGFSHRLAPMLMGTIPFSPPTWSESGAPRASSYLWVILEIAFAYSLWLIPHFWTNMLIPANSLFKDTSLKRKKKITLC